MPLYTLIFCFQLRDMCSIVPLCPRIDLHVVIRSCQAWLVNVGECNILSREEQNHVIPFLRSHRLASLTAVIRVQALIPLGYEVLSAGTDTIE
jgi:hypothetical protein